MVKNKISVIIPIYNTSNYIERCVLSITKQTYSNLEIVLINDGSTDNSLEKCYKLSKYDERIKVINKTHTGISDTRNCGLRNSCGEYISFIDSDDYISYNMYETMLFHMQKFDADIVECSFNVMNEDKIDSKLEIYAANELCVYNNFETINAFLLKRIQPSCCNKLFKRKIIENTTFLPIKRLEEYCFTWEIVKKAQTYVFIPEKHYYYQLLRPESITKSDENISIMNYIEFSKFLENHICIHYPQCFKEVQYYGYVTCVDILRTLCGEILKNNHDSTIKYQTKYLLQMKKEYEMANNNYINEIMNV